MKYQTHIYVKRNGLKNSLKILVATFIIQHIEKRTGFIKILGAKFESIICQC